MVSTIAKQSCIKCKDGVVAICVGCQQCYCIVHFNEHQQELARRKDCIGQECDVIRRGVNEKSAEHSFLSRIDDWEQTSIQMIRETTEKARNNLMKFRNDAEQELTRSLDKVTKQIKESQNYSEMELDEWEEKLQELQQLLTKPLPIDVVYDDLAEPLIQIVQKDERPRLNLPRIPRNATWNPRPHIIVGRLKDDEEFYHIIHPMGLSMDEHENLYIADTGYNRIVKWKYDGSSGEVVAGGDDKLDKNGQLGRPTGVLFDKETNSLFICDRSNKRVMQWSCQNGTTSGKPIIEDIDCYGLAMDNMGSLYVSDDTNNEVRRYGVGDRYGTVVAGGNGQGYNLNQLYRPRYVSVDRDYSVYVSEASNSRVVKWVKGAKEGIVVTKRSRLNSDSPQVDDPQAVLVDLSGTVYVADPACSTVTRWKNGTTQGEVIIKPDPNGKKGSKLVSPCGLSFDRHGNIYVSDCREGLILRYDLTKTN